MSRAPKVTWDRITDETALGCGSGFGESYESLLQIKRWNPSPMSVQVVKPVPPFKRKCHFFSLSEWYLAILFSWVGALIREQYPMWNWPHQHPHYGLCPELDSTLPRSNGMEEICSDAGIKLGTFVGTKIPYIWTVDLCLTLTWIDSPEKSCTFVSVKPLESERYLYIDPLDRGPEKLEAERLYAKNLNITYFVGDRSQFPGYIFGQLENLAECSVLPHNHPWQKTLQNFLDAKGHEIAAYPLTEILRRLQKDFRASLHEATFLKNHMLWNQILDCDVSQPIRPHLPAHPGGRNLRAAIRENLQGGK